MSNEGINTFWEHTPTIHYRRLDIFNACKKLFIRYNEISSNKFVLIHGNNEIVYYPKKRKAFINGKWIDAKGITLENFLIKHFKIKKQKEKPLNKKEWALID